MAYVEPNTEYEVVVGAGGDAPMDEDTVRSLKAEIDRISLRSADFSVQRYENDRVRFCIWEGRTHDARNWTDNVEHFKGESDQAVWMADSVINERVMQSTIALLRMQIQCNPSGLGANSRNAAKWTIILRWLVSKMWKRWVCEHIKLWNYEDNDTPAVALMRVFWKRETGLEMKTLTVQQLVEEWAQEYQQQAQTEGRQVDPAEMQQHAIEFMEYLADPSSDKGAVAAMVQEMFPRLNPKRAKKIAEQVAKRGEADFPVEIVAYDGPDISARRFGQDFYIPDNTREFHDSPWFEIEWISAVTLRERQVTMGWDAKFVEDVLAKRGMTSFLDYSTAYPSFLSNYSPQLHENEYQVLWAHFKATNEDGIAARYYTVLDYSGTRTAFGMRLEALPDKWSAVLHRRETIDDFVLNSRGVPEIVGPDQYTVTRLRNLQVDSAEIAGLPPFTTNDGRGAENLFLGPLKHLSLNRGAEAKFLQPPQPPVAARNMTQDIEQLVGQYWGRKREGTDPNMLAMRAEFDVGLRLASVEEELQILLDLAMQELPDEMLAQIMGPDNQPVAKSKEEIAGHFDVTITFDPAQLDHERLTDILNALPAIKQLDPANTIDMTPAAQYCFTALLPYIGTEAIRPPESGTAKEIDEAKNHLLMMRNGFQVPVDETGAWNYQLRAQTIEQALQADPDQRSIPAPYLQNIAEHLKALQFQQQQHVDNVEIGRQGGKSGSGPVAPATPPSGSGAA